MPFDRISVKKIKVGDKERFLLALLDSQTRNPFMSTSDLANPLSGEEVATSFAT